MNRHARRAAVAAQGTPWRKHQASARFIAQAQELEAKGLTVTPDQARAMLARWAASGGHIPLKEVEREQEAAEVRPVQLR